MLYYPAMSARHPRKESLVDVGYQLRFVTQVLLAVFTVAVASALLVSALFWTNLRRSDEEPQFLLTACLIAITLTLLIELLLAIPIVFVLGVRQSHRVVGPLKRITQTLETIGGGDFSQRLAIRKGDAWADVAASINRMAGRLRERFPSSSPR